MRTTSNSSPISEIVYKGISKDDMHPVSDYFHIILVHWGRGGGCYQADHVSITKY